MLNGTPNEFTTFNGVAGAGQGPVPLVSSSGGPTRPSRTSRLLGLGDGHAVQVDQAGGVALRRHGPGRGDVLARPHHRRGRHPPPVPPCDRHRADHPGGCRHPIARNDQRHQAAADGRREHGLHLGQGRRQRRATPYHTVFRDAGQPRDLSRRAGWRRRPRRRCLGN
jgi:hypothetical protein